MTEVIPPRTTASYGSTVGDPWHVPPSRRSGGGEIYVVKTYVAGKRLNYIANQSRLCTSTYTLHVFLCEVHR